MLTNRTITVQTNNHNITVLATRGTPQGGVLSPLLWIIIMNKLLQKLHADGFKAIGYADDLTVINQGKYLNTLCDRNQAAVRIVETWCNEVGLKVNPEKSDCIVFTKKRKMDGFKFPKIFGAEIARSDSVKYLGTGL